MRLRVVAALVCVTLPAVLGLRCYTCWDVNPGTCTRVWECAHGYDRCAYTIASENLVTQECMRSDMCSIETNTGRRCCSEDLCNGATPATAAAFIPLLLAPFAIVMTMFI